MQVTYAMGTAAEDVFSAYIYQVVPVHSYQKVTGYVRASGLMSTLVSGVLGDILVTQFQVDLTMLFYISAGNYLSSKIYCITANILFVYN